MGNRAKHLASLFNAIEDHATEALDTLDEWSLPDAGAPAYLRGASRALATLAASASGAVTDEAARFPADDGRHGGWIMTAGGSRFWPFDPRPTDVTLEDIAHSLALRCRWGGCCQRFYSVAEHSLGVAAIAQHLARRNGLDADLAHAHGLLHDAEEAYLADIPRPIKAFLPGWNRIADRVQSTVLEAIGLGPPTAEVAEVVRQADDIMLLIESQSLFAFSYELWVDGPPDLGANVLSDFDMIRLPDEAPEWPRERLLEAMQKVESSCVVVSPEPSAVSDWQAEIHITAPMGGFCKVCGSAGAGPLGLCGACL